MDITANSKPTIRLIVSSDLKSSKLGNMIISIDKTLTNEN